MEENETESIIEERFSDSGELESKMEYRIELDGGSSTLIGEYTGYHEGEMVINYSKDLSVTGHGAYVLKQKKLPEIDMTLTRAFLDSEFYIGLYYQKKFGTKVTGRYLYGYRIGQWVTSDLEGNITEIIDYDMSSLGRNLKKYTHKIAKTLLGKKKATQLANKYLFGSRAYK